MLNRKRITSALLIVSTVIFASGCTDHKQLKQDLLQAAQKQEQIQSYRFTGHAELKLDAGLFAGTPPLTSAMLSLLRESTVDYSGAVSLAEPVRMEASLKVTPKGAASSIDIPILIKDNKMYVQLPAINKPDEYLLLPLEKGADRLHNTGHLGSVLSGKLLQGIDPNWLEPGSSGEKPSGGDSGKKIALNVTSKNQKEAASYLNTIMPLLLDELMTNGLASGPQAEQWKKTAARLKLTAPTSISTLVDGQGYIREQSGKMLFQLDNAGPVSEIDWTHTIVEPNQPVTFTKDEPSKVKNGDDILRMLAGPKK